MSQVSWDLTVVCHCQCHNITKVVAHISKIFVAKNKSINRLHYIPKRGGQAEVPFYLNMEFIELILISKLDGVILKYPHQDNVDGTVCITGHHLILSSRKEGVHELWVSILLISVR